MQNYIKTEVVKLLEDFVCGLECHSIGPDGESVTFVSTGDGRISITYNVSEKKMTIEIRDLEEMVVNFKTCIMVRKENQ